MSSAVEERIIRMELLGRLQAERLDAALKRLAKAEQAVRQSGGGAPQSGGGGGFAGGLVTTAIPTGTPASPSTTGSVQVYVGGAASGDPVAVKNRHTLTASVAVGKAVQIAQDGADWYLVSADC